MKRSTVTVMAAFAAVLGLAGCSPLKSTAPAPLTYTLQPALASEQTQTLPSGVLYVMRPSLPSGFDTDRIALFMDGGRRIDYYAGARWAEPLDSVLQNVMVRSGRHELPNMIVDTPDLSIPVDYKLAVKVNDFAPVYAGAPDQAPAMRLSMTFTLVSTPHEDVLADFTLESQGRAQDNSVSAVTAGLENMLQAILPRAYSNVAEAVQSHRAAKSVQEVTR